MPLNHAERTLLQKLAASDDLALAEDSALRALVHEGYVEQAEGRYAIAVPLFRAWIRERA